MTGLGLGPLVPPAAAYVLADRALGAQPLSLAGLGLDALAPRPETLLQGRPSADEDPEAVAEAARAIEGYFLTMLLREMRYSPLRLHDDEDGYFAASRAEEMFTRQLDQVLSEEAAVSGQLGLADIIVRQLLPEAPLS